MSNSYASVMLLEQNIYYDLEAILNQYYTNYIIEQSLNEQPNENPVPDDVINSLSVIKVNENFIDTSCVICRENFLLNEDILTLPCNHLYHEHCIKDWFKRQNTCPTCRFKISDDVEEQMSEDTSQLEEESFELEERNSVLEENEYFVDEESTDSTSSFSYEDEDSELENDEFEEEEEFMYFNSEDGPSEYYHLYGSYPTFSQRFSNSNSPIPPNLHTSNTPNIENLLPMDMSDLELSDTECTHVTYISNSQNLENLLPISDLEFSDTEFN